MKESELIEKLRDMNQRIQMNKDIGCSRLTITNDFLENLKVD